MITATQKVTSIAELAGDRAPRVTHPAPWASGRHALAAGEVIAARSRVASPTSAAELVARVRGRAPVGPLAAACADRLRVRHIVAARRAEAARLTDCARWSQHSADNCWYAGKLRAARQFDAQAARERALAEWLAAEANALAVL